MTRANRLFLVSGGFYILGASALNSDNFAGMAVLWVFGTAFFIAGLRFEGTK